MPAGLLSDNPLDQGETLRVVAQEASICFTTASGNGT